MANQIETNLFEEELSDADLMAVVGGNYTYNFIAGETGTIFAGTSQETNDVVGGVNETAGTVFFGANGTLGTVLGNVPKV